VAAAVFLGRVWLPHLMLVAAVQTSLAIFYQLAERAAVRNLVAPEHLTAALTQNETRSRAAVLLGQIAGGLLFTVARWVPFFFTSIAHFVSLVMLLLIRRDFQQARARPRRSLIAEVGEGVTWMWEQRFLRTVMGFIAISNVAFQGLTLALMLIVRDSGGSAALVGFILGVSGAGGMIGALTGTWWMRRATLRSLVIGGLTAWMLTMPAVAFTSNPVILCVLIAANSYVGGLFNLVGGVYMVRITPDAVMGRVGGVATLLASGTNFLGALVGGFLLGGLGVRSTVLWLSVVMALLVVLSVVSPSVRSISGTSANRLMSRGGGRKTAAPEPAEPRPDGHSIENV
jgi:predicted MFS family arabinose efflux permease